MWMWHAGADTAFTKRKNNPASALRRVALRACFSSFREVCPLNCLEGSVACCEALTPILKATGCHLTSAITRLISYTAQPSEKYHDIKNASSSKKQTNPVNTLICCLTGARCYGLVWILVVLNWHAAFIPKFNVWRELQSEIIRILTHGEIRFYRCRK